MTIKIVTKKAVGEKMEGQSLLVHIRDNEAFIYGSPIFEGPELSPKMDFSQEKKPIGKVVDPSFDGLAWVKPTLTQEDICILEGALMEGGGVQAPQKKQEVKLASAHRASALETGADVSKTEVGETFVVASFEVMGTPSCYLMAGRKNESAHRAFKVDEVIPHNTMVTIREIAEKDKDGNPTKVIIELPSEVSDQASSTYIDTLSIEMWQRGVGSFEWCKAHLEQYAGKFTQDQLKTVSENISPRFGEQEIPMPETFIPSGKEIMNPFVQGALSICVGDSGITNNIMAIGDASTGKNTMLRHLAHLFQREYRVKECHGEMPATELIGSIQLTDGKNGSITTPVLSDIMKLALKGHSLIVLDEINALEQSVLLSLHSVLESSTRTIALEGTERTEKLPSTAIFAATANDNSEGEYGGTNPDENLATSDRFAVIHLESPDSITEVLNSKFPKLTNDTIERLDSFWRALNKATLSGQNGESILPRKIFTFRSLERAVDYFSKGFKLEDALALSFGEKLRKADGENAKNILSETISTSISDVFF